MPFPPPETESDPQPRPASETNAGNTAGDAPVSFVPHTATGAVDDAPQRFRTGRFGEREVHELVGLLDSVEDERARARFRESIYISVFVWLAVVALMIFGPKYLWHAPKVRFAPDMMREHEMLTLNAPRLPHTAPVQPAPIDEKTLRHLRETERQPPAPTPEPPKSQPVPEAKPAAPAESKPAPSAPVAAPPVTPRTNTPLPSAPQPSRSAAVPDAPAPQPSANPYAVSRTPEYSARPSMRSAPAPTVPLRGGGGGAVGSGAQILSDTQGVDFDAWIHRFVRETQAVWEPMLPQEVYPPLSKRGTTAVDITIGPDGSILHMTLAGSTHDEALNRAAWGSITSQGKLQPLPTAFHGPNIVLRCYFVVGDANQQ